jgi:hypothetical protein
MKKRQFLGAALLSAGALPTVSAQAAAKAGAPALLTVAGAIARSNRGPFDPALDQMMAKHKVSFGKACTFDYAALLAMPAITIKPTLEYDAKVHALRGPLLLTVLAAAGAHLNEGSKIVLRAVDGYAVTLTPAQARAEGFIVATHLNGKPMPLGGLGPLWAVCDADRVPQRAALALKDRYGQCPWGLYHAEVMA